MADNTKRNPEEQEGHKSHSPNPARPVSSESQLDNLPDVDRNTIRKQAGTEDEDIADKGSENIPDKKNP